VAAHGEYIATAGYDNKVILWNSQTGKAIARGTHDHLVNNCSFSSDGKWLVSASSDCSARLWSIPSMRLKAVLVEHHDDVDMAVFSPNDQLIATCALDRKVRIFSLNGDCLHTFSGHTGNVLDLAWTADGQFICSTSVDGTIRKWNVTSGVQAHQADLQIRTDSLAISKDGVIYAGDDLGRIAVIDADDTCFVQAHKAGIKKIALNSLGDTLVCLSYDRSMSIWHIQKDVLPVEISRTEMPDMVWARAAVILENNKVATGTFGSTYGLFNLETGSWNVHEVAPGKALNDVIKVNSDVYAVGDAGTVLKNAEPIAEMGSLCNFLVHTHQILLTGGQSGFVFNAKTSEVLFKHHSPLNCGIWYEYAGKVCVAIGTYTGEVLVFNISDNGTLTLVKELKIFANAVKGLSYKNGILFSVCASTEITWHHVVDWKIVKEIDHAHDRIANDCCVIDDEHFATVSRDKTLRIWGNQKTEIYPSPHHHSVKCISINQDNTKLLTGSYGGTLALFDLQSRRWTQVERPTMSGISAIAWDEACNSFIAASYDGHVYPMAISA